MNTKALAVLGVVVALLMGWLLVSMSAPQLDTSDGTRDVDTEAAAPSPEGVTEGDSLVETSVIVGDDNVETSVKVAE